MAIWLEIWFLAFLTISRAYVYDPAWVEYNLNQNKSAVDPLDYWGEWLDHNYTPSPTNWRFPFYTLFLDRFVNGDPTNDNINNTAFEHVIDSNQIRHGGDLQGLMDTLDYIEGMGVKESSFVPYHLDVILTLSQGLYIAGSPFMNQPWGYDQYSPVDLTLLDQHFGTLNLWRQAIDAIHARNMYVVLDNTFATMGDLLGFQGYLNVTAPFLLEEHHVQWKSDRIYHDFRMTDNYNSSCNYPRFWLETGFPVGDDVTSQMRGCYDSDFDQYGDTEAFGVYPDWRRQLSKFASVQDRLREWHEPVRRKIENFYCILLAQLDIDGFRYDKATQSTVDAMGYMNDAMRQCARAFGKDNFFLPGEITGGNVFGSIFLGRGRQPDMRIQDLTQAVNMTNTSDSKYFLREPELSGLDSAAFHYTVYRTLTRFLGMDGNLAAGYDSPLNWVDMWNDFLLSNDLVNANTGKFDPRHMYGVTNQDVFRWPSIENGIHRQLLGHFITSITMPGLPLLLWGEEQAFYVLDNTATNYIFGRQPMSAATAWKTHGCYSFPEPSTQYFQMPLDSAKYGCHDDTVIHDHRDPSHPVRNIIKHMFNLRESFPVLNDGFFLQQLSNQTTDIYYPGSADVSTETGLWSVLRSQFEGVQNLTEAGGAGKQPVWLLYSNWNTTQTYQFDCSNNDTNMNTTALIAPFDSGTTVRNLFYPYDIQTLQDSPRKLGFNGSTEFNGCLPQLDMDAYGFRAYVPIDAWTRPRPMITKFTPGHDARLLSNVGPTDTESVFVELQFSAEMDCESVSESITLTSSNELGVLPAIDNSTIACSLLDEADVPPFVGAVGGIWIWNATIIDVPHGVHRLTVNRPKSKRSPGSTNATDHFLFRTGSSDNPIVFPLLANYSTTLVSSTNDGKLTVNHAAAGADKWRYSTNWGTTFSDWLDYTGGSNAISRQNWTGTEKQNWHGDHVRVQYFSRLGGSSSHIQEGDSSVTTRFRRFPHLFLNGPYNMYGYDAGLDNEMKQVADSAWEHHLMTEWQTDGTLAQINVWGINPDGLPDQTMVYGDADGDSVLDRLPPSALSAVVLNITQPPAKPYLGWNIQINDGTMRFKLVPSGSMWYQMIVFCLLVAVPVISGAAAVWTFMLSFYDVKFNKIGIAERGGYIPLALRRPFQRSGTKNENTEDGKSKRQSRVLSMLMKTSKFLKATGVLTGSETHRRTVLIATMEYDIEDWNIKIKIGGLGVMAQLMGKNLGHQDLIWVVPCVGGVEYPTDETADPMVVKIFGNPYEVQVQYHKLRNITYVLLDAPVFRQQTKAEPYPPRMDDISSAIYYSAWNQCIAQAVDRFPIDLYHINDYHGTVAPLYLLPRTIPACLSLHNAEFQGLWPIRTRNELDEVCAVFNLPVKVVQRYVQFGEVFNLLHAGASYLRVHQQGFGAVGVSKKYGKRAWARYPIFWGLKRIGQLPNPDPSDVGEWDKKLPKESDIKVDPEYEASRGELRRQAQEWAGLEQDPNKELFVFVGRWSMQKGIDLIADIFPSILEAHPNVQLITVGPVIDLYGKFAAAKFDRMMKVYPGRVCSKPVFTALPPFIFSGAEFALIPSRDEPFGLVAVEFGRKGALGVGARVGGLGQMPGWWFTVESTTTSHLLHQFRLAIEEALSTKTKVRALMRARSAKQRFPVAQWTEDLEILQTTSIRIHDKMAGSKRMTMSRDGSAHPQEPVILEVNDQALLDSGPGSPQIPNRPTTTHSGSRTPRRISSRYFSGSDSNPRSTTHRTVSGTSGIATLSQRLRELSANLGPLSFGHSTSKPSNPSRLSRQASLGYRQGPGHVSPEELQRVEDALSQKSSDAPSEGPIGQAISLYDDGRTSEQHERDLAAAASIIFNDVDESEVPQLLKNGESVNAPYDLPPIPHFGSSPTLNLHFPNEVISHELESGSRTPGLLPPEQAFAGLVRASASPSTLSVDTIVGDRTDFALQKVDPFFTDSNGAYYGQFEKKLKTLSGANSETSTCIEEYLVKSEKKWFEDFRDARLGRYASPRISSAYGRSVPTTREPSRAPSTRASDTEEGDSAQEEKIEDPLEQFLLGKDYVPPTGLAKWMQIRLGDWPVYAFFMAFGQIIAANSYQITLLTGEVGQSAVKLYAIASVYLVTSILWWIIFRCFQSRLCLSLPFFFYGLAFVAIGISHYTPTVLSRGWVQNVASGLYAVASSSGSIFFSLNFGDEGGAQVKSWVFRACVIQGTQQIYVVLLWYWGSIITRRSTAGSLANDDSFANSWKITAVTIPIAAFFWVIGLIMWFGLPKYYRQQPGAVPNFYQSIARRKIVLWFFVAVLIQNFFLSAPYGRSWSFLFSSTHATSWQIMCLVVGFFIGVWSLLLWFFGHLSKSHTWILPLFAVGLGAPRWAQIWWGTSNLGLWLPWTGSFLASALVSRSLWLWLGVLDAIQGVGLGMILLGTLTRIHVCFTLIAAQVLGSVATMLARAFAPNKIGPGPISPDITGTLDNLWQVWFWVGLVCNLAICFGFFTFYRKEQLTKP